ncbi:MAG: hypothetical protein JSU90_01330 [Nitrospiraceae bacterium]|nr:MAG: hypothetical protein JSU90_01330 [Nitrospiraceae bacterium]
MKGKFLIGHEVTSRAVQCGNDYSCLSGAGECLCEVLDALGSEVIFVRPLNPCCTYMSRFGYSSICHCPARKEIYRRYHR